MIEHVFLLTLNPRTGERMSTAISASAVWNQLTNTARLVPGASCLTTSARLAMTNILRERKMQRHELPSSKWKQIKGLKELRGKQLKEIIRAPNPEESRNRMGRKYTMALKVYLVVKRRSLRTSDSYTYEETSQINFFISDHPVF